MNVLFRALLRLYPADFRARFQGEMLSAHEESGGGLPEIAGVLAGVAKEWIAKWTTAPWIRARCAADWTLMRPPGLSREDYFGPEPAELGDARRRVEFCLDRMMQAIAERRFDRARYYSKEDLKARDRLRRLREKYGIL